MGFFLVVEKLQPQLGALVYVVTLRQKLMCPSGKFCAVNLVLVPLVRSLELGP